MEDNLIEHIVVIDEYVSATIKIPKTLTAMDLKALMSKATKLFNLAEVPIRATKTSKKRLKKSTKRNYNHYNINDIKEAVEVWENGDEDKKQEISDKLGLSRSKISKKIWYWKNKKLKNYKNNSEKPKRRANSLMTPDEEKKFIEMVNEGVPHDTIAKTFNLKLRQVWDLKYKLKQQGKIKDED